MSQNKTAILSVYDKTGLLDLAKGLVENNVRILASGGTSKMIREVGVTVPEAVEEIDIGGVTLLRAAAKNHARVTILSDPKDYSQFVSELKENKGDVSQELKNTLALKAVVTP